jgi:predicted phage baseplate assembly protein
VSNPALVSLHGLGQCGCCTGVTQSTPGALFNRPGLSALAYRIGTHSAFKQSFLAALSRAEFSALQQLRSRADDDFTIALLDAAATMADVLTFYQERMADEAFLRTASERRSILELARLIGYELHPGVAASAVLAFSLDTTPGAPAQTFIDAGTRVQSIAGPNEKPQTYETIEKVEARVAWNALTAQRTEVRVPVFGDRFLYLKGIATNLRPGDAILLVGKEREDNPGREEWDFRRISAVDADAEGNRTRIDWAEGLGTTSPHKVLPAAEPKIYALKTRAGLFGFNAPVPKTLSDQTLKHYDLDQTNPPDDWTFTIDNKTVDLDTTYPAILKNSWLVLSKPTYQELYRATAVVEAARAEYTLSGKTTRIALDTDEHLDLFDRTSYRDTLVFAQSELLEIAEFPIAEPITGAKVKLAKVPDGIKIGQLLAASGKDVATGETIQEVVSVNAISATQITVTPPLAHRYERGSFSFNANLAHATHGETVEEILGSGDAGQGFQKFQLKQPPLTYVSASNPSGAASTLEVRVNDVRWHEAETFFERAPKEHVFISRRDDDGKNGVQFGDGKSGARLPSGANNLRAKYRKGIGIEGLVKAGQLSMLLSRPLGVNGVTNPLAASGAQDPEQIGDARANAPLRVLTLERVVSLRDYQDFARAFGGVAKALASWSWDGRNRAVLVTVAGPAGAPILPDGATYQNLLKAMRAAGDPFVALSVKTYRPAFFRFAGKVKIDPAYEPELVLAQVELALRDGFSFAHREFAQPVTRSEVIAAMQSVAGVIAVDVDKLYRSDKAATLEQRLLAEAPVTPATGELQAAELLTLDAAPLDQLGVMA